MKKFTSMIICCSLILLVGSPLMINAQNKENKNAEILMPIFPIIAEYEYAPVYLWQDINNHSQYSGIMAIFDPKDASSVEVVLEEKTTNNRVYYCDSDIKTAMRKTEGKEAILSKIDFKISESDDQLPIYGFGFPDKNGQPILWRVIPTSKPSIRGAGLTPLSGDSDLRIEYRDIGTTVGEGTAVKIGDKVFEAQPWAEISSPPYFYAFHGSFTIGRHIGVLRSGTEKWNVTSQPKNLNIGEKWILTNERGYKRTLKIVSDDQNELVIDEVNPQYKNASLLKIVVHITSNGYNLRSMKMNSNSNEMQIKFEPELPIQTSDSADFEGEFMINQGENKNVVMGMITRKQLSDSSISLKWLPKSPDWAKSKYFESFINIESNGYSILTKNPKANP